VCGCQCVVAVMKRVVCSVCVCVCGCQCVLEDSGESSVKPVTSTACSSTTALPSLTLTSVSQSNTSVALTGSQRCSANALQAFDRLSLSTCNMVSTASTGRRLSLGTLRLNSSHQRQASASSLCVDGSRLSASGAVDADIARRAVTSGRSPRVRRKLGKVAGRGKDKRSVKLSKVVLETKPPVVDDWLKFDFSSVMSGASDAGAGDDGSADEDGGVLAAPSSLLDVAVTSSQRADNSDLYVELGQLTKSVGKFTKLAYPDMCGHVVTPFKEAFYEKRFGTQR